MSASLGFDYDAEGTRTASRIDLVGRDLAPARFVRRRRTTGTPLSVVLRLSGFAAIHALTCV